MSELALRRKYPKLKSPPIEEAVISVGVEHNKDVSTESLEKIFKAFEGFYPNKKEWRQFHSAINFGEDGTNFSHNSTNEKIGFLFSDDIQNYLHCSKNKLIFNKLKPYISWENFSDEYKKYWEIFSNNIIVSKINDLSLRYINSFYLNKEDWHKNLLMGSFFRGRSDYDSSEIGVSEIFSRYVLNSLKYTAQAVVLLTINPEEEKLKIIMDIDVKNDQDYFEYENYSNIYDTLERLRLFKNHIFFSNLPNAQDLFS
jgi:uncharacterized protein (TIGR04255 family)